MKGDLPDGLYFIPFYIYEKRDRKFINLNNELDRRSADDNSA
jgi:hypothetical protein